MDLTAVLEGIRIALGWGVAVFGLTWLATYAATDDVESTDGLRTTERTRKKALARLGAALGDYGGGFYGTVALCSFVKLELELVLEDWRSAGGLVDFLTQELLQRFFLFGIESLFNGLQAGLWPFYWFTTWGLGAVLLGIGCWLAHQAALRLAARRTETRPSARPRL